MAKRDAFGWDDIVDKQKGIFDGTGSSISGDSALEEYAKAKTTPTPEGLKISFTCEGCGAQRSIFAEYPELIAIKYGLQPHRVFQGHNTMWGFDQDHHAWFPDFRCSCSWPVRPMITVPEAEVAIRAALQRGWLHPQQEKQLSQHCFQVKQAGG